MAGDDEEAIRALAVRVVQGADEHYDPPAHLLEQLRDIVKERPHDTLFRIERNAGDGYGMAYCLEEKCRASNKHEPLIKMKGAPGGGRQCGIGNLFKLTWHQTNSSSHLKAVKARLAAQGNTIIATAPLPLPPAPLSATSTNKPLPSHIRKNSLAKTASSNSLKRNNSAIIVIDDSEDENEDPAQSPARKDGQSSSSSAAFRNKNVPASPGKASACTSSLRQMEAHESQERESKKRRLSEVKASSFIKNRVKNEENDQDFDSQQKQDENAMQMDAPDRKPRVNSALSRAGPSKPNLFHSKAKQESDDEEMKPLARTSSSRSNDKASTSASTSTDSDWITLPSIKRKSSTILLDDSDAEDVKPSLAALKGKKPLPKVKPEDDEDEASQPAFAAVSKTITARQQKKLEADWALKHKQFLRFSDENRQARQILRQRSGMEDTRDLQDEVDKRDADMRELEDEMKAIERELQSEVVKDEVMDEEVDELMSEKEDIKPKVKDDSDTEMLPDIKTSFVSRPKLVKQTSLNRHWGNVGGVAGPSSERSSSASASSKPKAKFEEDSDDEDDKKDIKPKIDDDDEDDAIMRDLAEATKNPFMGFDPAAGPADDEDLEGVDENLKDFLRSSKHMQDFESETSVESAMEKLGLTSLTDKLKDTNISLYAHQVLGVTWALGQEAHKKYKGGIIADEMGLGKTVQMISIISQNQSRSKKEKTTLILAPLGLLQQWKDEIESKTQGRLTVHVYHGTEKAKSLKELRKYDVVLTTLNTMAREWVADDSIALKRKKAAAKKAKKEWTEDDDIRWHESREQDGLLFRMTWHRIVIDEAQNIRNKDTVNSRAVSGLEAEYRWCLTGTPVTNTLTDVYALFRFLCIKPGNQWDWFRDHVYCYEKRRPDIAGKRVQAILKHCCIRRNKNSELNGKRLITLPDKHVNLVTLDFTAEEREIYTFVETKSQQRINRYLKEGSLTKNYANILVMLLRLRQLCGHASLIAEDTMNAAFEDPEAEAKEKQRKLNIAIATMGESTVIKLQAERLSAAVEQARNAKSGEDGEQQELNMEECQICLESLSNGIPLVTKCGHIFCSPCLHTFMTELQAQEMADGGDDALVGANAKKEKDCPKCRQKISLGTSFQMSIFEPSDNEVRKITKQARLVEGEDDYNQALKDMFEKQLRMKSKEKKSKKKFKNTKTITLSLDDDEDAKDEKKPKPKRKSSKNKVAKSRIIADSDDEGSNAGSDNAYDSEDSFIDDSGIGGKDMKKKNNKGKGKAREESEDDIESADSDSDSDSLDDERMVTKDNARAAFKAMESSRRLIPSTKLTHNLKLITEAPDEDKFMVVSQWTTMLDLTAAHLKEKKIPFLRFQALAGDMSRNARDDAVKKFNTSPKYKCLLMSLKAGGVGLTLTGGNRVVFLDLAWNPATELQAMDRLHRISQRKEVFVSRLVIRDSVEDRILALQERKQGLADAALGEGKGGKIGKLSVKQLKQLFGMVPMNAPPGGAEDH